MHPEQRELLKELAESRGELMKALDQLGEEGLNRKLGPDSWRVRDMLAHLTHWNRWGLNRVRRAVEGEPDFRLKGLKFDVINQGLQEAWSHHPSADVIWELKRGHSEIVDFVSSLDDRWFDQSWQGSKGGVTLKKWLGFLVADHERAHARGLRQFLEPGEEKAEKE